MHFDKLSANGLIVKSLYYPLASKMSKFGWIIFSGSH